MITPCRRRPLTIHIPIIRIAHHRSRQRPKHTTNRRTLQPMPTLVTNNATSRSTRQRSRHPTYRLIRPSRIRIRNTRTQHRCTQQRRKT